MARHIIAGIALVAFLVSGCDSLGKYGEAKRALNDFAEAMDAYSAALEKSATPADVVAATDAYTKRLEVIMPKIRELEKKNPESRNQSEPPAELKDVVARVQESQKRMVKNSVDIFLMKYPSDADVQKANMRLVEVLK
ncbi:MAG TPA: hypothetical protein PKM65_07030 [Spirochaetota bacterium]|nr:hypothetical protein [Spirochaetota bacterium]HNT09890.1 hypothetical protein [Spirochaetota bacterium]